ncbi:MAG: molybdenum cofactor biosynthesis protein MoaE [Planctomycetes bacterium]|nr:molybdenum cofactor biosynthesis protein MoaE [Planctomycetota bacterium]
MEVTVLFFASLRERAGCSSAVLELAVGADVAAAKRAALARFPELRNLDGIRGALREAYVNDDARLADGDELALLPPVSGGAPDRDADLERGLFELASEPIDVEACRRRVAHESCGAAVVFVGSTRDSNRGKDVVELEYEAFAAMAGPEMARSFERCVAEHGSATDAAKKLRMLCVHRTGRVGLGEPSVVIAVASPHRAAAFEACRFLIEELKRSLPVWKKERYVGGEHWIGDRS